MIEDVILLHGFGGTRRTWDGVGAVLSAERYRPLALDLPGHGEHAGVTGPIDFDGCVEHVLGRSPERFVLCGYSLGGRVALHVALAAPERVSRVVLISTSPGIEDAAARAQRSARDRRLAEKLEREPFERFIAGWRAQQLFADDPSAVDLLASQDYRRNRPDALAAALRGIGTGEMRPLWDRLGELQMHVTLLAGDRDAKFQEIGERMLALLPAAELVRAAGGHRLALEDPAAIARAIEGAR